MDRGPLLRQRLTRAVWRTFGTGSGTQWRVLVARSLIGRQRRAVDLPWSRRLSLARSGFLPISHVLYDLDVNDPAQYVSDRQQIATQAIDGPVSILLADKLAFFLLLAHLGAPTPTVEAVVTRGRIVPFGRAGEGEAWLRERLAGGQRLVIKPARGWGGSGVMVLEGGADGPRLNFADLSWDELFARVAELDDCIVTPHVAQAAYSSAISPSTTNTLRILTMADEDGRAWIAAATHRFGRTSSRPVDSWSKGGLSVGVEVETGRLGRAATRGAGGRVAWVTHHPDTGAQIAETSIPGWAGVREGILDLAERLRFLPYIGWDVVVTDGGFAVLEGNHFVDVAMQMHGPLLRDPRTHAFFRGHGIVP